MSTRTIRRTLTLRDDATHLAKVVVQNGRAIEFIFENRSRREARVRFGRLDGKGHILERRVDARDVLRADRESGLDPAIDVTVDRDGAVRGVTFDLVWPPLTNSDRA